MRVSAQTKAQTHQRILGCARKMLSENDFHAITTRDIAATAGIAAGTFFNYFPSKEALLLTLVEEAFDRAATESEAHQGPCGSLAEELFAVIAVALRALRPHRAYLPSALELLMNPIVGSEGIDIAARIRSRHLEQVAHVLRSRQVDPDSSFVTLHLYWTLFVGVLSFWTRDESPNQEDTLVLLDRSMQLLSASLAPARAGSDHEVS